MDAEPLLQGTMVLKNVQHVKIERKLYIPARPILMNRKEVIDCLKTKYQNLYIKERIHVG